MKKSSAHPIPGAPPAAGHPPGAAARAWSALAIATLAGWATLPWARYPLEVLRGRGLLTPAVAAAFGAAAGLLLVRLGTGARPAARGAALAALGGLAWLRARSLEIPEERLHLVQYGLLAVLAAGALARTLPPGRRAWAVPGAAATGALLGLADELIQGAIPSRVFDLRDVRLNAEGAALGALAAAVLPPAPPRRGRRLRGTVAALAGALLAAALAGKVPAPTVPAGARADAGADAPPPGERGAGPAPYPGASILVLTLDALRADALPSDDALATLPGLRRLLAESIRVEGFQADSGWTLPSMISMLTGLSPAVHGVEGRGVDLAPGVHTPIEAFAAAGWRTAGHYGEVEGYRHLGFQHALPRDEGDPVETMRPFLSGRFLVWRHLTEMHLPFDGPVPLPPEAEADPLIRRMRTAWIVPRGIPGDPALARRWARPLYDAQLPELDARIAATFNLLEQVGALDRTIWVVTSDHGEELFERGWVGHASTSGDTALFPEILDIPLIVRLPDRRRAGEVVDLRGRTASLVDLMPTLAELAGVDLGPPGPGVEADGASLVGALLGVGEPPPPRVRVASSSPCGWRCPPERAGERYHAVLEGAPAGKEPGAAIRTFLAGARSRRAALGTPVPEPEAPAPPRP